MSSQSPAPQMPSSTTSSSRRHHSSTQQVAVPTLQAPCNISKLQQLTERCQSIPPTRTQMTPPPQINNNLGSLPNPLQRPSSVAPTYMGPSGTVPSYQNYYSNMQSHLQMTPTNNVPPPTNTATKSSSRNSGTSSSSSPSKSKSSRHSHSSSSSTSSAAAVAVASAAVQSQQSLVPSSAAAAAYNYSQY